MAIQEINKQEIAHVSGGILDLALGGLVPGLVNTVSGLPLVGGLLGGLLSTVTGLVTGLVGSLTGSTAPLGNQVNGLLGGSGLLGSSGLLGGLLSKLGLNLLK
ncbi:MAG: hypothetical protein PHI55_01755 [Burkholderiaceae bacterium]|nr:hypothetical protein [Burkholderiaceae bacterium]